ncbi:MAG: LytTR family DNA-binding domain-containing protein, partial [Bacteroidia bacterium]|nr:LytTR family DNA-binding domain-containing protein [Bacteroidia bacterium]
MVILIIEDEAAAAGKLLKLISQEFPQAQVMGPLDSIEDSIDWLENHDMPDLIYMDIQLADGHSFEIFKEIAVTCPVIFTTAFDEHALSAFKHNGIDYLLKPIKESDFEQAAEKYRRWIAEEKPVVPAFQQLLKQGPSSSVAGYQKRLVIRYGQQIKALEIADAAFFYIESKVTILKTFEGKDYPVDQNLEELSMILDPEKFFRINRKMTVNVKAITQMIAHSKSRVRLILQPTFPEEVVVSAERAAEFKEWLKGLPQ